MPREAHNGTVLLDAERAMTHLDRLFRYALMVAQNHADADDLVQDVVERLLRRPRRVDAGSELGYLSTMIRHRHMDSLRERFRRPIAVSLEDPAALSCAGRAGERPEERAEQREVLAAVAALNDDHREVLVAVDIAGLSYKQAAAVLGIPVGTVMSRVYRARARVAQSYDGELAYAAA